MNDYKFQPGDRVKYVGITSKYISITNALEGEIGTYEQRVNRFGEEFAVVNWDWAGETLAYFDSIVLYDEEEKDCLSFDNNILEIYLKEMCI